MEDSQRSVYPDVLAASNRTVGDALIYSLVDVELAVVHRRRGPSIFLQC